MIKQGEVGSSFFVIVSGEVAITINDKRLVSLGGLAGRCDPHAEPVEMVCDNPHDLLVQLTQGPIPPKETCLRSLGFGDCHMTHDQQAARGLKLKFGKCPSYPTPLPHPCRAL